jgi:hypothetical protein
VLCDVLVELRNPDGVGSGVIQAQIFSRIRKGEIHHRYLAIEISGVIVVELLGEQ